MSNIDQEVKLILSHISKFSPSKDNFLEWLNKMEFLMDKFNVEDHKKAYILLDLLEPSVISYLESNVKPCKPINISFETIVAILEEKYSALGTYKSIKYRFLVRDQFQDEPVINYFFSLKKLNDQIISGPEASLKLFSRLLMGLKNPEIREMLSILPSANLYSAVRTAIDFESLTSQFTEISKDKYSNLMKQFQMEEKLFNQATTSSKDNDEKLVRN